MTHARLAVHVHSDWSRDARLPLAQLSAELGSRGYDAVLMADHDIDFDQDRWEQYRAACANAGDGALLVAGIEYSDPDGRVHVPVWGAPRFLGANRPTEELLADVRELGAIAMFAHPGRAGAAGRFRPGWADSLAAVEVWNRKYDGVAPGATALEIAQRHPELLRVAGLDLHTRRQLFPLALQVDLRGPLSEASVLEALRERRGSATALGLPLARFGGGPIGRAARLAERGRRCAAKGRRRAMVEGRRLRERAAAGRSSQPR